MKNPFSTKKPVIIKPLEEAKKRKRPFTFQEELQQKQKQIMGGVYYRSALESNMQERLSKEADEIAVGLRNFLAQPVTVLKPPSGKVTVIDPQ